MNKTNIVNCILCESSTELKYKKYPGYKVPSEFNIHYCTKCNTSFSMPRVDSTEIYELIYKNGPEVRWYDRYWRNAEIVKTELKPLNYLAESEDVYWSVIESIRSITENGKIDANILEIGCGLGYLTYSLNKEGYSSQGLDISQAAVNQAIQNYGDHYICADIQEYAINHGKEYDVVIFTEVIEHLNDISIFMESIKKLLKSDGKIILTTPNKSFYPKDIIWATDLPPVHCWWLSEDSIQYIASKLNMNVSFLNFKKFYLKHATWVDLTKVSIPFTPQVFDREGRLIGKTTRIFKDENVIKKILKKVEFLKLIYAFVHYFRVRYKENILIPRNRGPVLCAILFNKQEIQK